MRDSHLEIHSRGSSVSWTLFTSSSTSIHISLRRSHFCAYTLPCDATSCCYVPADLLIVDELLGEEKSTGMGVSCCDATIICNMTSYINVPYFYCYSNRCCCQHVLLTFIATLFLLFSFQSLAPEFPFRPIKFLLILSYVAKCLTAVQYIHHQGAGLRQSLEA